MSVLYIADTGGQGGGVRGVGGGWKRGGDVHTCVRIRDLQSSFDDAGLAVLSDLVQGLNLQRGAQLMRPYNC